MANVKISELPQTTRLQSTDIVASVSGSTTTKITVKNLADSLTQVSSSILASQALSVGVLNQNVVISGSISISGSIVPAVSNGVYTSSFSLGSPTNAWKDIYVSDGTIFFTDPGNGQTSTLSVKSGLVVNSGSGQINSGSIIHRTAAGTFTARTDQMSGSKIFGDTGSQTNAMLPEGYEVYNLFNALQYNGQSIVYLYGITNPSNGALKSPLSTSPIRIVNRKAGYPVMRVAINQIDQANGINFTEAGSTLNTTASIYLPTGSYVDLYVETEASGYSGDSWVIVGSGSLESLPSTTPPLAISASYALTASFVNNLNQNVTITGSLNISGSSTSIVANNGYVVLTQVSRSLNFTDDTAAAAGGVPLGGLYRNGNFIVIRLS